MWKALVLVVLLLPFVQAGPPKTSTATRTATSTPTATHTLHPPFASCVDNTQNFQPCANAKICLNTSCVFPACTPLTNNQSCVVFDASSPVSPVPSVGSCFNSTCLSSTCVDVSNNFPCINGTQTGFCTNGVCHSICEVAPTLTPCVFYSTSLNPQPDQGRCLNGICGQFGQCDNAGGFPGGSCIVENQGNVTEGVCVPLILDQTPTTFTCAANSCSNVVGSPCFNSTAGTCSSNGTCVNPCAGTQETPTGQPNERCFTSGYCQYEVCSVAPFVPVVENCPLTNENSSCSVTTSSGSNTFGSCLGSTCVVTSCNEELNATMRTDQSVKCSVGGIEEGRCRLFQSIVGEIPECQPISCTGLRDGDGCGLYANSTCVGGVCVPITCNGQADDAPCAFTGISGPIPGNCSKSVCTKNANAVDVLPNIYNPEEDFFSILYDGIDGIDYRLVQDDNTTLIYLPQRTQGKFTVRLVPGLDGMEFTVVATGAQAQSTREGNDTIVVVTLPFPLNQPNNVDFTVTITVNRQPFGSPVIYRTTILGVPVPSAPMVTWSTNLGAPTGNKLLPANALIRAIVPPAKSTLFRIQPDFQRFITLTATYDGFFVILKGAEQKYSDVDSANLETVLNLPALNEAVILSVFVSDFLYQDSPPVNITTRVPVFTGAAIATYVDNVLGTAAPTVSQLSQALAGAQNAPNLNTGDDAIAAKARDALNRQSTSAEKTSILDSITSLSDKHYQDSHKDAGSLSDQQVEKEQQGTQNTINAVLGVNGDYSNQDLRQSRDKAVLSPAFNALDTTYRRNPDQSSKFAIEAGCATAGIFETAAAAMRDLSFTGLKPEQRFNPIDKTKTSLLGNIVQISKKDCYQLCQRRLTIPLKPGDKAVCGRDGTVTTPAGVADKDKASVVIASITIMNDCATKFTGQACGAKNVPTATRWFYYLEDNKKVCDVATACNIKVTEIASGGKFHTAAADKVYIANIKGTTNICGVVYSEGGKVYIDTSTTAVDTITAEGACIVKLTKPGQWVVAAPFGTKSNVVAAPAPFMISMPVAATTGSTTTGTSSTSTTSSVAARSSPAPSSDGWKVGVGVGVGVGGALLLIAAAVAIYCIMNKPQEVEYEDYEQQYKWGDTPVPPPSPNY